jgi:hypothetical protein
LWRLLQAVDDHEIRLLREFVIVVTQGGIRVCAGKGSWRGRTSVVDHLDLSDVAFHGGGAAGQGQPGGGGLLVVPGLVRRR